MSPPRDDRALRRLLRAGDADAFETLFGDHADVVFTLAHRLTGEWSMAEDVTSETFLVAWRSRSRLRDESLPLRPWLLGIAARQAMNASRGRRRRLHFLSRHRDRLVEDDFADEAAARLDDAATLSRAAAAVARLGRHEAEVLGLCVWSGMGYAEAAQVLDVPIGTVRSRLSRARAKLRTLAEGPAAPSDHDHDATPATRQHLGGRP